MDPTQQNLPETTVSSTQNSTPNKFNPVYVLFSALLLLIGGLIGYTIGKTPSVKQENGLPTAPEESVICTMDAKICPDGSAVGRSGPNCEFAQCPEATTSTKVKSQFDFLITYPPGYEVMSDTGSEMKIGTDGIEYLTIRKDNTIDVTTLPKCSEQAVFPCLSPGKNWDQQKDIEEIVIGTKPAISFFIATGTVDSDEHVIQVKDKFEARMNVAGGGLEGAFQKMIHSISFEN